MLTCEALGGDGALAVDVGAACTFVYLGADLLDNIADRELDTAWAGRPEPEVALAATTLIAPLPQLAIARLGDRGVPSATVAALSRLLAEGLLTMSAGQFEDLRAGDPVSATCAAARATAERKAGGEFELFTRAGATLAGAPPDVIDALGAYGRCLGTALQIASDVDDLLGDAPSRDLLNGKVTLPLAHALESGQPEERAAVADLLAEAPDSADARALVHARLRACGSLVYTALVVGTYSRQALAALTRAGLDGPEGRRLRELAEAARLTSR